MQPLHPDPHYREARYACSHAETAPRLPTDLTAQRPLSPIKPSSSISPADAPQRPESPIPPTQPTPQPQPQPQSGAELHAILIRHGFCRPQQRQFDDYTYLSAPLAGPPLTQPGNPNTPTPTLTPALPNPGPSLTPTLTPTLNPGQAHTPPLRDACAVAELREQAGHVRRAQQTTRRAKHGTAPARPGTRSPVPSCFAHHAVGVGVGWVIYLVAPAMSPPAIPPKPCHLRLRVRRTRFGDAGNCTHGDRMWACTHNTSAPIAAFSANSAGTPSPGQPRRSRSLLAP